MKMFGILMAVACAALAGLNMAAFIDGGGIVRLLLSVVMIVCMLVNIRTASKW